MHATAFNYDQFGTTYSAQRQADPRIEFALHEALGSAQKILNLGAGTGSYEPKDRDVVALEPSATMRAQRPKDLSPAIHGVAEHLPFLDNSFEASMAVLTTHHWADPERGLAEMKRVTSGPAVVLTFDPDAPTEFWISDYLPEMKEVEQSRYLKIDLISRSLGGNCEVQELPVTADCRDKFQAALYARPEEFLRDEVRQSQSAWDYLPDGAEERFVQDLAQDLESGEWDRKYGQLREKSQVQCQLRLIVSEG